MLLISIPTIRIDHIENCNASLKTLPKIDADPQIDSFQARLIFIRI